VQANPHIALHVDPPSMPELMIACDVALGAGGSTAWERACLGLPSIAIILADNQRPFARELDVGGVLLAFEKSPDLWTHVLPSLSSLADGGPAWHEMSRKAADICDGLGARRIARTMLAP
jgi:spore coat polysaccharide biosynthesis predicted glycosyltransferase SpsG